MFAHDRQKIILDLLAQQNSVRTQQLVARFDVSLETIRRDLEALEAAGLLRRVHGGAVLETIEASPLALDERQLRKRSEKVEIGTLLCRFLKEGQSVALDAGTTTLEVARVLKEHFEQLIVLTNSLDILNELSTKPQFTLISPGGCYNPTERTFVGALAEAGAASFHVDTAVITVSGISLRAGFTDYGFGEVSFKKKLLSHAREVLVVADSGKFDTISLLSVCGLDEVHRILTDSALLPTVRERYEEVGCEIVQPRNS